MPSTPPRDFTLLMVDDETHVIASLKRLFRKSGYRLLTAKSGDEALAIVESTPVDAAMLDYMMPGMDGLSLLERLMDMDRGIQVLMLTGSSNIEIAVKAMKAGAVDFIEKPYHPEALMARVTQLANVWQLRNENVALSAKLAHRFGFDPLIGSAHSMLKVKETVVQVGPNDATVLINGETGTGKELVAQAIHYHSTRSSQDFVPVDCGAITGTIIESELFGHVKGAFTGANQSAMGLIRSAHRGTLFLDEIGELPLEVQAKFLRVLQERVVRPVGSSQTFPADIRIVSATNRDLAEEVAQGRFREDLYYRLNVVRMELPPLRERKEDIPLLVDHFEQKFSTNLAPAKPIHPETMDCLVRYAWPGNIRELENVVRRVLALGQDDQILPSDLPAELHTNGNMPDTTASDRPADDTLAAYERLAIANALAKSRGNRKRAAQFLGIGEATLYRKIKLYELA